MQSGVRAHRTPASWRAGRPRQEPRLGCRGCERSVGGRRAPRQSYSGEVSVGPSEALIMGLLGFLGMAMLGGLAVGVGRAVRASSGWWLLAAFLTGGLAGWFAPRTAADDGAAPLGSAWASSAADMSDLAKNPRPADWLRNWVDSDPEVVRLRGELKQAEGRARAQARRSRSEHQIRQEARNASKSASSHAPELTRLCNDGRHGQCSALYCTCDCHA